MTHSTTSAPAARERVVAVLVVAILVAGVLAALAKSPAEESGLRRADIELTQMTFGTVPVEDAVGSEVETTQTSAPRDGKLDIASNAPAGTALTLPELAPVDLGEGQTASAPVTGGYTDLIRMFFGEVTVEALVIVQCESQFIPWAVGTNTNGTQDHGLFQINDIHQRTFEAVTGSDWEGGRYDPVSNTTFARWLYDRRGWDAWTCRSRLDATD